MPNRLLLSLGLLDEAIHPFHRMLAAVTFVGTLSLQAVVTSYLEPVKVIWYSFALTFPLTTGLTIIFLILYHFNWKKFGFADAMMGAGFFALLFLALNGLNAALHLEKMAKAEADKDEKVEHFKDSLDDPTKYQQLALAEQHAKDSARMADRTKYVLGTPTNIHENIKKLAADFNATPPPPKVQPWYYSITRTLAAPFVFLWVQLQEFYRVYGASRFWSGVVLAFCFSLYINLLKKKLEGKSVEGGGE